MRKYLYLLVVVAALLISGFQVSPVQAQGGGTYVVQYGDNLFSIAARFGVSVSELATINGIYDVNLVYVGQVLVLPAPIMPPVVNPPVVVVPPPMNYPPVITTYPPGTTIKSTVTTISYVVKRGDTLSSIAYRFRVSPYELMNANGIMNPNLIYVGQLLRIPRAQTTVTPPVKRSCRPCGTVGRVYIVQPGDTLSRIAQRFGRDPYEIARINGLINLNYVFVGQALIIP